MSASLIHRLARRDGPLDLVLVGLGFMGAGFLRQAALVPGVRVPLVITRDPDRSAALLRQQGCEVAFSADPRAILRNAERGIVSLWPSLEVLERVPFPIVVEMSGAVEYGARVALAAFESGKHVVTFNPELHVTLGSALHEVAASRGLVFTDAEGDQPGTLAALMEQARSFGFVPLMAGNLKGHLDRTATPDTMRPWAERHALSARQTTAFADGTKLAFEMALVANYFGMRASRRGMQGPAAERVEEALTRFDWANQPSEGSVDYLIGAGLPPGVFVIGTLQDPRQAPYLRYMKLGDGPRYLLQRPFHLCHLEAMESVARVALWGEATIHNGAHPTTQVIACPKRPIQAGETLDASGGYCAYGLLENIEVVQREGLAPMGLLEGAVARRNLAAGVPIPLDAVELPSNLVTTLFTASPSPV